MDKDKTTQQNSNLGLPQQQYPNKKQFLKMRNKWKKSNIRISKRLRDIIHGYIMSDGYVRNGILTIDQGEKQKHFVNWLYDELELIRTLSPISEVERINPKTKKLSRSYRFNTRAFLQGFQHLWYESLVDKNGVTQYRKRLPKSIDCFFNETFLSLWFAGDGTKVVDSVGAKFEVTAFTTDERLRLKNLFFKRFGIQTSIVSSGLSLKGTSQWALKIPASEYQKFRKLITKETLIPQLFPYKLHKKI